MQARPPERTLGWLVNALDAAEVIGVEWMRGSSTSALHRITLRALTGATRTVVMRRYVLEQVVTETPNIADHEVIALRIAATAKVPTPELLVEDSHGRESDAPTVVMSSLEGRPRWEAQPRRQFVAKIAEAMVALGDVELPSGLAVRTIQRYAQSSYAPPRWSTRPGVWEPAVEVFHEPIPADDVCFVHGPNPDQPGSDLFPQLDAHFYLTDGYRWYPRGAMLSRSPRPPRAPRRVYSGVYPARHHDI